MEEKREKIVALLHAETPISDIVSEVGTSRRMIFRVKNSLKDSGHVKRKPGSGRKPTVVTEKLVWKIEACIRQNPIRSMKAMVRDMNLSDWTVQNVINNKLGPRSLSRMQRFLLSDRLKALRLQRSKNILAILKKKTLIILFSDKKNF